MTALKKPLPAELSHEASTSQSSKELHYSRLPLAVTNKSQELFDTNFWATTALKKVEDLELNALADARENEKMVKVSHNDL